MSSRPMLAGGWRGGWLVVVQRLPLSLGRLGAGAWRGCRLGRPDRHTLPCGCRLSCVASMRCGRRHTLVLLPLLTQRRWRRAQLLLLTLQPWRRWRRARRATCW